MYEFFHNESGASLVEYGLLVGLIAVAAIAAVTTLGDRVTDVFIAINDKLGNVLESMAPQIIVPD